MRFFAIFPWTKIIISIAGYISMKEEIYLCANFHVEKKKSVKICLTNYSVKKERARLCFVYLDLFVLDLLSLEGPTYLNVYFHVMFFQIVNKE